MHGRGKRLRGNLCRSIVDGSHWAMMNAFGEQFLPAFALAVGLGEVRAGLIATLPLLGGAIVQLLTPTLERLLGSPRRVTVFGAGVQAASWIPLVLAAYWGQIAWPVLLLVTTLYWGGGLIAAPPWNTWMGRLVPRRLRSRYFAHRSRTMQIVLFLSLLAAGWILERLKHQGEFPLWAFVALFSIAGTARFISTGLLYSIDEPAPNPSADLRGGWRRSPRAALASAGRILVFVFALQFSLNFAQPYVNPFLLSEIRISGGTYSWMLAALFLSRVVALSFLGRVSERRGALFPVWLGTMALIPIPALWIVSREPAYLFCLQFLTGAALACYELGIFLLMLEVVRDEDRTRVMTAYNLIMAAGAAGGSLAGGWVLRVLNADWVAYVWVFSLACGLRAVALALLIQVREHGPTPRDRDPGAIALRPPAPALLKAVETDGP